MSYVTIQWFDGEKVDKRKRYASLRIPAAELPSPTPIHAIKWDDIKYAAGHYRVLHD